MTPAHIVPEWYFLPFYAILRSIPDKLLGVIAMFGSILILFALPWLDTSKVRSANYRPIYRQFFWILVIDCIGLGYRRLQPAGRGGLRHRGGSPPPTTSCTSWRSCRWSVSSRKPRPAPISISEAVLPPRSEFPCRRVEGL